MDFKVYPPQTLLASLELFYYYD